MTSRRNKIVKIEETNPADALRQGWLAWLGAYGLVFERAKPAIEKLSREYEGLFGDLVEKGEEIEAAAKERAADARDRVKEFYGAGARKIRAFSPADDRVKKLEAEVEALTKKLAARAKKPAVRAARRAKAA